MYAGLEVGRDVWRKSARLVMPDKAVLCGLSAVSDYGVDVRAQDDHATHVALLDHGHLRSRDGIVVHRLSLRPDEVCCRNDWLVTTPARTALDCARWLTLVEATVVVDALLHCRLTSVQALIEMATDHRGERGSAALHRCVGIADGRAESPMETRQRLILVLGGLPVPEAQFEVFDTRGKFVARLDLAYVAQRVAVEFDGALHWTQRRSDDRRRDKLRALGWTVLVFSADEIYNAPARVVELVAAALERCAL
jgi:hypothetical protein